MDNICARDVMHRNVLIIREDAFLHECVHLLCEGRITGMPVANVHGMLTGIVSQTDLIRHQDRLLEVANGDASPVCVRDIMTRQVACAGEDASLGSLMDLMMDRRIHRVIITSGSAITGIVSTMDIMALMVRAARTGEGSKPDYSNLYSNRHERLLLRQEHIERMRAIQKSCAAHEISGRQDPVSISDIVNACLDFVFEHPVPFSRLKCAEELQEMISGSVYRSLLINAQASLESSPYPPSAAFRRDS